MNTMSRASDGSPAARGERRKENEMSRSVRHYNGLRHTASGTKSGRKAKRIEHGAIRARLKANPDEAMPLGKKCHRANRYDGASMASAKFAACDAAMRSDGYDPRRSEHRMKRR